MDTPITFDIQVIPQKLHAELHFLSISKFQGLVIRDTHGEVVLSEPPTDEERDQILAVIEAHDPSFDHDQAYYEALYGG